MAVAPKDGSLRRVSDGVEHSVDVDVVVACSVHLRKTYFMSLIAVHHNLLLSFCRNSGAKVVQKGRINKENAIFLFVKSIGMCQSERFIVAKPFVLASFDAYSASFCYNL